MVKSGRRVGRCREGGKGASKRPGEGRLPQGLAWLAGRQHLRPPHPPRPLYLTPLGTRAKPPGPAPRLRPCPPRDLVPAAWAAPQPLLPPSPGEGRERQGSGGRAGGAAFVWGREPPLPGPSLPRPRLLLSPTSCCPAPSHLATGPDVLASWAFSSRRPCSDPRFLATSERPSGPSLGSSAPPA